MEKLSITFIALSRNIKNFKIGKENYSKDSRFLHNKTVLNTAGDKKNIEVKERKMKNKKYKKSHTTTDMFSVTFSIWKNLYFVQKHSLEKPSLYHYIYIRQRQIKFFGVLTVRKTILGQLVDKITIIVQNFKVRKQKLK